MPFFRLSGAAISLGANAGTSGAVNRWSASMQGAAEAVFAAVGAQAINVVAISARIERIASGEKDFVLIGFSERVY
jgi:hypothetical protein